jgi:hypothetical protein
VDTGARKENASKQKAGPMRRDEEAVTHSLAKKPYHQGLLQRPTKMDCVRCRFA